MSNTVKTVCHLNFEIDLTFDAVVQSRGTFVEVEMGTLASDEL